MFGGKDAYGQPSDKLVVFKVSQDPKTLKAMFKIVEPTSQGKSPAARFSHTINYMQSTGMVAIYGGRND